MGRDRNVLEWTGVEDKEVYMLCVSYRCGDDPL